MFGQKWRFEDIRILVGVTFLSAHTLPGRRLRCPGQISVEQTADICTWQILLEYSVNIPVYLTQLWNIFAKGENLFSSERPRKNINFDENISGCWFRKWFRGSCVEFQTESDCLEKWTCSNVTAFHRLTRGKWKVGTFLYEDQEHCWCFWGKLSKWNICDCAGLWWLTNRLKKTEIE